MKKTLLGVGIVILLALLLPAMGNSWSYGDVDVLGEKLNQLDRELKELEEDITWVEVELGSEKVEYIRYKLANVKKDLEFTQDKRRELVELIREARLKIEQATTPEEKQRINKQYDHEIQRRMMELEAIHKDIRRRLDETKKEKEKLSGEVIRIQEERKKRRMEQLKRIEMAKPIWERGKVSLEVAGMTTENFSTTTIGLRGRRMILSAVDVVIRVDGLIKENEEEKKLAFFPALEWRGLGFGNLRLMPGFETESINWKVYPSFGVLWEDEYSPQQTMKTHSVGYYLMFQWLFSDNAYRAAFGITW